MNYTTKELSNKCGVTSQTIRNLIKKEYQSEVIISRGSMVIPDEIATKILEYYDIKNDFIEEEQPQEQPQQQQDNIFLKERIQQLEKQIEQKDIQINTLLEQASRSQEQLTQALEQAVKLSEANKALSAANAVQVAADKKEIILSKTDNNKKENKSDKPIKKHWWQKLFK